MTDPRPEFGLYALPEAARLVRVPRRTLENWVKGYRYRVGDKIVSAKAVIHPARDGSLSFVDLMEALTLAGYRRQGVSMQRVRKALDFAARALDEPHVLASERLLTGGKELFWEFQQRDRDAQPDLVLLTSGQRCSPKPL